MAKVIGSRDREANTFAEGLKILRSANYFYIYFLLSSCAFFSLRAQFKLPGIVTCLF